MAEFVFTTSVLVRIELYQLHFRGHGGWSMKALNCMALASFNFYVDTLLDLRSGFILCLF